LVQLVASPQHFSPATVHVASWPSGHLLVHFAFASSKVVPQKQSPQAGVGGCGLVQLVAPVQHFVPGVLRAG
jgi:hypothetical protein